RWSRGACYIGGTCPGSPACLFAAASQDGSCGFIRAEILGAVDMQQLCQPCTRAIDARFDRADCATTDARSFLVGKSRRAHEDQGLALIGGNCAKASRNSLNS